MAKAKEDMYTGNKELFTEIKNFLLEEGFTVENGTHIGEDRYEFEENWLQGKLGCHNLHKILAWKEGRSINYKTHVIGSYCID